MIPKPGQIVHCTRCDEPVFLFNENTQVGAMAQDCIDPIGDQKFPECCGDLFKCHKCNEPIDLHNYR